jgi:hypothetical protein
MVDSAMTGYAKCANSRNRVWEICSNLLSEDISVQPKSVLNRSHRMTTGRDKVDLKERRRMAANDRV